MSMFKSFIAAAAAGADQAEAEHAAVAIGTSAAGAISGDPLAAGVGGLVAACVLPEARTPSAFAGLGTSVGCALLFGPLGGLVATTALCAVVRVRSALNAGAAEQIAAVVTPKPEPAPAQAAV